MKYGVIVSLMILFLTGGVFADTFPGAYFIFTNKPFDVSAGSAQINVASAVRQLTVPIQGIKKIILLTLGITSGFE